MNPEISALIKAIDQNSNSILVVLNIILVIVTAVYVILTWRTVREMRKAREAELEAHLVATLEPMGAQHAKVSVRNVGGGPALNVELTLSVRPQIAQLERNWQCPAMWPGRSEYFLIPSQKNDDGSAATLLNITGQYHDLVATVGWRSLLGKPVRETYEFDLKALAEGWYNAGNLIPVQTTEESLKKLEECLSKVEGHLRTMNRTAIGLQRSVDGVAVAAKVKRITRVRTVNNSHSWRSSRPRQAS